MSPSPIRLEYQRSTRVSPPLTTARAATTSASSMTTPRSRGVMPLSISALSSSGVATTSAESMTTRTRKNPISRRNGRA